MHLILTTLILTLTLFTTPTPAAPSRNPTIAIIPGSWTTAPQFTPLITSLKAKGYHALTHTLPSVNSAHPESDTVATDTKFYYDNLLRPQVEAGKDVVLVMHSYGGIVGSAAAVGLSKVERRAKGQKGGIIGLVMIAAFPVMEGTTVLDHLPGHVYLPWFETHNETHQIGITNPASIFLNDIPANPPSKLLAAEAQLGLQSSHTFDTPSGPPAWKNDHFFGSHRRVYIKTTEDHALVPAAQEGLITASGVEWDVKEIQAGHCPFVSRTEELAGMIVEGVRGFEQVCRGGGKRGGY